MRTEHVLCKMYLQYFILRHGCIEAFTQEQQQHRELMMKFIIYIGILHFGSGKKIHYLAFFIEDMNIMVLFYLRGIERVILRFFFSTGIRKIGESHTQLIQSYIPYAVRYEFTAGIYQLLVLYIVLIVIFTIILLMEPSVSQGTCFLMESVKTYRVVIPETRK